MIWNSNMTSLSRVMVEVFFGKPVGFIVEAGAGTVLSVPRGGGTTTAGGAGGTTVMGSGEAETSAPIAGGATIIVLLFFSAGMGPPVKKALKSGCRL